MANRIIWSALITLALTFSPSLAFSTPTQSVKKKPASKAQSKSRSKTRSKYCKTKRTWKKKTYSRRRYHVGSDEVVQSSMIPRYSPAQAAETQPLMKVTPQRGGGFLLQPLSPQKPQSPLTQPSSQPANLDRNTSSTQVEPRYNQFTPWDFSDLVLAMAKSYKHAPYARGASLENGRATDCSGFVQFIYHDFKINLPRSSAEQSQVGKTVTREMDFSKMLPGDLLFFSRGGHHVGHAGIYLGDGKMIHASSPRTGVTVTDLRQGYYENTFVVAKRVFVVNYPN